MRAIVYCCTLVLLALFPLRGGSRGRSPSRALLSASSPPPSAAAVGLKGYRRFHANDSLIGRPVPCTRDEKTCLHYNLLFDPATRRCRPLGDGCDFAADREEFEKSGHVVGACRAGREAPCRGHRMAFDGRCYQRDAVRRTLCGCRAPLSPHPLGGVECRCPSPPAPPVQQPSQDGRCVFPDLRFPFRDRAAMLLFYPRALPLRCSDTQCSAGPAAQSAESVPPTCSSEQRDCFSRGMVWVPARRGCFHLLRRGPCENNYHLVLSSDASTGQLAVCRHVRGDCPPEQIRMAFDGVCHDEREMKMVSSRVLIANIFGEYMLTNSLVAYVLLAETREGTGCFIDITTPTPVASTRPPPVVSRPLCGADDSGRCAYEVFAAIPMPWDDE